MPSVLRFRAGSITCTNSIKRVHGKDFKFLKLSYWIRNRENSDVQCEIKRPVQSSLQKHSSRPAQQLPEPSKLYQVHSGKAEANRQTYFNHIHFFGTVKCFHKPISKPQVFVIQGFVTGISNFSSTEDNPEGHFLNEEPSLTCRRLNIYLLKCVI